MSLDLFSCIKGFIAITEYKSYAAAARQLHISAPVLTKQIARLEEMIGKKFFARTTRSVLLTEAGMMYLPYAKTILEQIQDAQDAVNGLEKIPHGQLNMSLPGILNSVRFMRILDDFLTKYPKITLQTRDNTSLCDLDSGIVDIMMSETSFHDNRFIKEHLWSIRRCVFASPSYLERNGAPRKISELKNHNCLIYTRVSPNNEWIFSKNKKINVSGNYSSSIGTNIIWAAIAGIGLMWCPELMIQEEIKVGLLVKVPLEQSDFEKEVYVYYKPVNHNHNIKLLLNHINQYNGFSLE